MLSSRRTLLILSLAAAAALGAVAFAQNPKKVESTDPSLRLQWADQYRVMKAQTSYPGLAWRFIGPDIIGGRCTDIAVPKGN
jgi:hypothetical protein